MPVVAAIRVSRMKAETPVEVPDHRLGKRQPRGVTRRERLARRRELCVGDLTTRLEPVARLLIVLENEGVSDQGRLAGFDIGDARRAGLEGRNLHGLEQVVDERLTMRRLLVGPAAVFRRQRAVGLLAAVGASFMVPIPLTAIVCRSLSLSFGKSHSVSWALVCPRTDTATLSRVTDAPASDG